MATVTAPAQVKVHGFAARTQGGRLEPIEYPAPELGGHDVLVEVSHCGLCHTDMHFINNDFGMTQYPFVPGHEVVGTVVALGREAHTLREGQRVGVGFQRGSCGHCEWCVRGEEQLCPEMMGNMTFAPYGGFASAVVVDERFAFPLPDGLASEHAGPLMCGGATVWAPLRRYCTHPGMRVGVAGIGGLGHMALQFARAFGCEVTAYSTNAAKEKDARALGAHHFVLSRDKDAMEKSWGTIDLLLCTTSAMGDWDSLLWTLRKKGTMCVLGLDPGNVSFKLTPLITWERSICGSVVAGRNDIPEMLEFAAHDTVRPIVETMPMAEVNTALQKLKDGRARYRVVLSR